MAENAGEEAAEKEAGEECKEALDEEAEEVEVEVEEEAEAETETEAGKLQPRLAVCVAAPPRPTRSNTAPTTLLQLGDHTSKGQLASEPSPPRSRPTSSTALTVTWRAGDRVHARYGARLVAKQYTRWFPGAVRSPLHPFPFP